MWILFPYIDLLLYVIRAIKLDPRAYEGFMQETPGETGAEFESNELLTAKVEGNITSVKRRSESLHEGMVALYKV